MSCYRSLILALAVVATLQYAEGSTLAEAEKVAVDFINLGMNTKVFLGVSKVNVATEEETNGGKLFKFELELKDTDCLKSKDLAVENCSIVGKTDDVLCNVSIIYSSSSGKNTVVSRFCSTNPKTDAAQN